MSSTLPPDSLSAPYQDKPGARSLWQKAASILGEFDAETLPGRKPHQPGKPSVLIVAHNATRTGAPILAQNLADTLSDAYNVVVLCLETGPMIQTFRDAATEVRVIRRHGPRKDAIARTVRLATEAHRFRFAIVNSTGSLPAAPALAKAGVPIVTLIHEFCSTVPNAHTLTDQFALSHALVFSTALTLEDARLHIGLPPRIPVHILPQGKCVVPGLPQNSTTNAETDQRIAAALRPASGPVPFVVLGAGTIEYRKGCDLFVTVAARAKVLAPEIGWQFSWIGAALNQSRVGNYDSMLADQVARSGVADCLRFLPPTPAIETAYGLSDVLLLPSRLDPLPNVAIDVLAKGRPVLCFEKATGIAELLDDIGVAADCVAAYLDVEDMARKLVALARSEQRRDEIGQLAHHHVEENLKFGTYAQRLVEIAETATGPTS